MTPSVLLPILDYARLDAEERRAALGRPAAVDRSRVFAAVRETVRAVRLGGDEAVLDCARRFDGGAPDR